MQGPWLSISVGAATGEKGQSLVDILNAADVCMYQEKQQKGRKTGK
ncbi:MAG: hypothetical protein IMZ61_03695 [Planctomycetes bacterium]|nr:hypothetical protein [Planctomycetota bacterium]